MNYDLTFSACGPECKSFRSLIKLVITQSLVWPSRLSIILRSIACGAYILKLVSNLFKASKQF